MTAPGALAPPGYRFDVRGARRSALGLLAGGAVLAHLPGSVGLPCPLRSLTGVPCPFCGLTTSVRAALGGHLDRAIGAAPLGLVVVGLALLAVSGRGPRTIRVPVPVLLALLVAEWVFELHRFHVLI